MGDIRVTVQTEKRLAAINNLSLAIRKLAEALAAGTKVEIVDNVFHGGDPAVLVETDEEVAETKIENI